METLVVEMDALKEALGITTDAEHVALVQFEASAVAWVERALGRRFQPPSASVEYREGSGTRTLFLRGHLDGNAAAPTVRARSLCGGQWDTLTVNTDYEVRGSTLVRMDGSVWASSWEYEITYNDGYGTAPADVKALVIELVGLARGATLEAEVKKETIGEYSYELAVSTGSDGLSDASRSTINGWRRGRI